MAIPGSSSSPLGPYVREYGVPHVYARDVRSGSGNCVCGRWLAHMLHTEVAPGVPIPPEMRPYEFQRCSVCHRVTYIEIEFDQLCGYGVNNADCSGVFR